MAGASKPASLKGMADRPSAAADFCNKICQVRKSPGSSLYSIRADAGCPNDFGRPYNEPERLRNLAEPWLDQATAC